MIASSENNPKPPITRQQRRKSKTRRQLKKAARTIFAEHGLDTSTIDQITERADLGKGTFYNHFEGKEGLIGELVQDTFSELNKTITARCKNQSDLGALLDNLISAHIEFFSHRWEDFILYFQTRADLSLEEGYSGLKTPFFEYLTLMERHIDGVIKCNLPQPVLRRLACALGGFVSGYYSFAAVASQDTDIEDTFSTLRGAMVASLTRLILEATLAESGENG